MREDLVEIKMPDKLFLAFLDSIRKRERKEMIKIIRNKEKRLLDKSYATQKVKEVLNSIINEMKGGKHDKNN